MSNWNNKQDDKNLQSTIDAGDNALLDLYKLQEEINNVGEAQANEAEQLNKQSDGLIRRMFSWLTVVIFVAVSLFATPTKAQSMPQVPPTPTVGEPARIERVYLPIAMVGETIDANVNWNSKRNSPDGAWQARGN